jgi:glycosyltransferase involved in cell wall biosynthesis
MPPLLNEAELFVFPSLYEGFGFPILEALACGCPTITTQASSLPEVAGDAALLVPAGSTDELGRAIGRMLDDSELRGRLGRRALERAQRFSWTSMARETLALLEEVASSGRS